MKFLLLVLITFFAFCLSAKAQVISLLPAKSNAVYGFTGSNEKGTYIGVGFARTVELRFLDRLHIPFLKSHPMMFFGEFSSRTDHFGNNVRFTYGAQTDIFHKGHFRLPFKKTFYVGESRNPAYKSLSIGAGLGFLPGFYGKHFSIALAIFYSHNWSTNVWDLDTSYSDDPKAAHKLHAGWNPHIGSVLKTALLMAYKQQRTEFFVEAGYQGFQKPNIANLSVFYTSFGLNYRF